MKIVCCWEIGFIDCSGTMRCPDWICKIGPDFTDARKMFRQNTLNTWKIIKRRGQIPRSDYTGMSILNSTSWIDRSDIYMPSVWAYHEHILNKTIFHQFHHKIYIRTNRVEYVDCYYRKQQWPFVVPLPCIQSCKWSAFSRLPLWVGLSLVVIGNPIMLALEMWLASAMSNNLWYQAP